jgi:hypothetical protein
MAGEMVKGSLLLGVVVGVRRLRDRGVISPDVLEARVSKEAVTLVDQKIEIARWYPMHAFVELIDLDWMIAGRGEPTYLEEQGARSADRLFDSKRYQQLDFAERAGKVDTREALIRHARLITTITGTFYNFLRVDVALAEKSLDIVYANAVAFAKPLEHTTVGFMNQINVRQGSKRRWTANRVRPDEVHFHMSLPERLAGQD